MPRVVVLKVDAKSFLAAVVRDGGAIPTRTDETGLDRPATPSYAITVSIAESRMPPVAGLRGSAAQLAAAIRYCYDRAITTNSYYRLVLDFDQNSYWAERSEERMLLGRGKENAPGKGQAFDQEAADKRRVEEEAADDQRMRERGQGLGIALEPPPRPKRAKFQTFQDAAIKQEVERALPLLEAVEHAALVAGLAVDARIERGRTPTHALQRLWDVERFDRLVAPAPANGGGGFSPKDLAWILTHAPCETLVLRPAPAEQTPLLAAAAR